jgi:chromate transporter
VILADLALTFGVLSLIAFGGMPAVMPEMQRLVVDVKGWTTHAQFIQLFAIAQAAPGPNVLIVSLISGSASRTRRGAARSSGRSRRWSSA